MSLLKFVTDHNTMDQIFGGKDQWTVTPTPEMAQQMFSRLDSNMSPEALFADGERPRAQANRLAKEYRAAWADLLALGHKPQGQFYNMVM